MEGLGEYKSQENCFKMYSGAIIWMRTGTNPDSVVGLTNVRAILCDEAGLYTLYFWQNILGRSSFCRAPIRIVTSPYNQGWLFRDYIRHAKKDPASVPGFEYIHARSDENPYFPKEEYEERKRTMDPRRFNMMYGGEFERMIGLVYDCFEYTENIVAPFSLPSGTRFFGGIDFGTTNPFALVVVGITPDGLRYGVGEYYKSGMSPSQMASVAKQYMGIFGVEKFFADPSGAGHIEEMRRAKIPIEPGNNEVDHGIAVTYEIIKSRQFMVFEGKMPHLLDEIETYHYQNPADIKPDQDEKNPKPVKQNDHCCDALRMLFMGTRHIGRLSKPKVPDIKSNKQPILFPRREKFERWG
jgi:hypothetical protein